MYHKSICFVIPRFLTAGIAGAELQVYFLSEQLVREGWTVEILSRDTCPNNKLTASEYYNPRITYYCYKKSYFRSLEFVKVLWILFRTKSSYYYQRTDFSLTGAVAFYCKLFRNKKFIYATSLDSCVLRSRYSGNEENNSRKNSLTTFIRKWDMILVDRMVEYGKKHADLRLCQSDYQRNEMMKNLGLDSMVLRNSFVFPDHSPVSKENIVIWVGNCRPAKQPELFLRLADQFRNSSWKFVMIGNADETYRPKINKLKQENFSFLGPLPYDTTTGWFKKAKIIVNTSKVEGFPNTFIQAWLYRVLVMSLQSDPDDLLVNKGLGFCAKGDLEVLTQRLEQCINNDIDTAALEAAYTFALREFDIKSNTDKLLSMLENL